MVPVSFSASVTTSSKVSALVLRAGAIELAQALDVLGLGLELARGGGDQHALEIVRGVDRRIADHEGDARGIGAVVLRHHVAVAGDDAHARHVEAEHLGDRLHQDGGRALADVGGARQHHDRAVEVELDLHRGVRLAGPVHRLRGAARCSASRQSPGPCACRCRLGSLPRRVLPAALALDPVDAFRQAVAVHHQVVVGEGRPRAGRGR